MTFRVGQKVVCINGVFRRHVPPPLPILNVVYTVSWVAEVDCAIGRVLSLDLVELPSPETAAWVRGYHHRHFRPAVDTETDISFAHEILRKASKKQGVDA